MVAPVLDSGTRSIVITQFVPAASPVSVNVTGYEVSPAPAVVAGFAVVALVHPALEAIETALNKRRHTRTTAPKGWVHPAGHAGARDRRISFIDRARV
jgi:hypothetical protein